MIKTETISADALRITAPEKLNADDFHQVAPQIDSLISQHGKIRLLIDASGANGWENIAAFENHAGFIKNQPQKALVQIAEAGQTRGKLARRWS